MAIGRATLPQEFYDRTSARMLIQPEPQYVYGRLVYMADAAAELRRLDAVGLTPDRAIPAGGAPVPMFAAMQLILSGELPYSEAILVADDLALEGTGHTVRMNRPVFGGGGYTAAARTVAASTTISTTPIDLTMEQVAITIFRRAGPYDTVNSRIAPRGIDRLDATRAVHSIAALVGLDFQRDRTKALDSIYGAMFDRATGMLYPNDPGGAITTDAAAFAASSINTRTMDFETLLRMQTTLELANAPRFANGQYVCVLTVKQAQDLMLDPLFSREAVFTPSLNPINPLAQSLVKSIAGVDVYRSNTNTIDTSTVSGVAIGHGVMFGPNSVGRVSSGPCRVADSADDNYGETAKVIWLAYEGESILDNRFQVSVHTN